jgi:hypothetical protein
MRSIARSANSFRCRFSSQGSCNSDRNRNDGVTPHDQSTFGRLSVTSGPSVGDMVVDDTGRRKFYVRADDRCSFGDDKDAAGSGNDWDQMVLWGEGAGSDNDWDQMILWGEGEAYPGPEVPSADKRGLSVSQRRRFR